MSGQWRFRWNVAAVVLVGLASFALRVTSKPSHTRREAAHPMAVSLLHITVQ